MVEFRASNWEDKEYDSCGNTTVAALEINSMTIPLCMDCVEELIQHVDVFKNTIFCYQCNHFICSESGWKYGGSCKLKALKEQLDSLEVENESLRKKMLSLLTQMQATLKEKILSLM